MDEQEFNQMNVIPLVDVMLVLLTIVLTTSTFIATGVIPVELPKAKSAVTTDTTMNKTIEIDKDGIIYHESNAVSLEELKREMESCHRDMPVQIRADKNIPLSIFVEVMDTIKGLGFTKLSLQTEASR